MEFRVDHRPQGQAVSQLVGDGVGRHARRLGTSAARRSGHADGTFGEGNPPRAVPHVVVSCTRHGTRGFGSGSGRCRSPSARRCRSSAARMIGIGRCVPRHPPRAARPGPVSTRPRSPPTLNQPPRFSTVMRRQGSSSPSRCAASSSATSARARRPDRGRAGTASVGQSSWPTAAPGRPRGFATWPPSARPIVPSSRAVAGRL